jgi:hypothetical protein
MIENTLTFIRDIINQNFKREFSISENIVLLSNFVNPDGTIPENLENKIVFFLVNLKHGPTLKNNINRNSNQDGKSLVNVKPTINLNLQLIFCANFVGNQYDEGLKYLSSLIHFFQINARLSPDSFRTPANLNLAIEPSNLNFNELNYLWSAIGSKIVPSVVYNLRLSVIEDMAIKKSLPTIKTSPITPD